MNDRKESAIEMLHALKDAIQAVEKIPNCKVTSVRYDFNFNADARDPDWEQCKEVYSKIPYSRWLESKYSVDEDKLFKVGDVQMRYKGGVCNPLQLEVDGKWYTMTRDAQKAPFMVKFCCKKT